MVLASKVTGPGNREPEYLSNPRSANFGAAYESSTATHFRRIPSPSACSS